MSDGAAHLEQCVMPEVPVRHWICAFPWGVRAVLGHDKAVRWRLDAAKRARHDTLVDFFRKHNVRRQPRSLLNSNTLSRSSLLPLRRYIRPKQRNFEMGSPV